MKALSVEKIDTYYGTGHVLHGVSLEAAKGQVVCLLGRNGAGKSTAIRSIMGMTPASAGSIRIFGEEVLGRRSDAVYKLGVRIVPQGWRIFPMLTVEENLCLGIIRLSSAEIKRETERAYALFPLLSERRKQKARTLSGGELQMLAIARAIVGQARILLMDEPSEGLAPLVLSQIGRTVLALKETGMTVLLAEQNLQFSLKVADYYYIIDNGANVFAGSREELAASDVQVRYLGVSI